MSDPHPRVVPALRLAARQDGALTYAQAIHAGLTPGQVRELVRSGGWRRPFRGALLVPGAHPERGQVRAALLLRPGAVVCDLTAARLHRLDGMPARAPDEPVHLLAGPDRSHTPPKSPALALHRGPLRPDETTQVWRMPVTSVTRTLADLVLASDRDTAVAMLDAALHDGSLADIGEVRHALAGRRASVRAAGWLRLVDGRAESPLESRLRLLLVDAGLPPEEVQWPVTMQGQIVARLDLAWPSRRVCVEADGAAFHGEPHALHRDRHRQNLLVSAGWVVLRFTWADLVHSPADLVHAVASALGKERAA